MGDPERASHVLEPDPGEFLRRLGEEIGGQDNSATARPLFVLQQQVRRYGIDPGFHDPDGWTLIADSEDIGTSLLDPNGEIARGWFWRRGGETDSVILVDAEGDERFEAYPAPGLNVESRPLRHRNTQEEWRELPDDWEWRPFMNEWEDVQGVVAFTREGINHHLSINRHNYRGEVRIWVASMFRCHEMERVRDLLLSGLTAIDATEVAP